MEKDRSTTTGRKGYYTDPRALSSGWTQTPPPQSGSLFSKCPTHTDDDQRWLPGGALVRSLSRNHSALSVPAVSTLSLAVLHPVQPQEAGISESAWEVGKHNPFRTYLVKQAIG